MVNGLDRISQMDQVDEIDQKARAIRGMEYADDLSRPARLVSEAVTLPALEPEFPEVSELFESSERRSLGALRSVRRVWPDTQPEQHVARLEAEMERPPAERPDRRGITMGRAALHAATACWRR